MAETEEPDPMMTRFFLVVAIATAPYAVVFAETYTNSEFGFQAELPPRRVVCVP